LLASLGLGLVALGPTIANMPEADGMATLVIVFGPIVAGLTAIFLRRYRGAIGRGLALCAASYLSLYLLFALARWQTRGICTVVGFLHTLGIGESSETPPNVQGRSLAGALALPLLVLVVLAVVSLARRAPVASSMAQGFRRIALPAACILVLVYGGLMLGLARQENRVSDSLTRQMQGEGPYLAELAHQPWPE
jgi:hypothetical protein